MADEQGSKVTLVIGGAKSGKSRHAQLLAEQCAGEHIFIATAQAFDEEMADRITRHRADRDDRWRTLEAPIRLPETIAAADHSSAVILVDCLTLWVSNLMLAEESIEKHLSYLNKALSTCNGQIAFVTNEVGWGVVPDNALARRFRDVAGRVNQFIAGRADEVHFVVAGLTMRIK